MASRHLLAVDLGAESGRVMRISYDGNGIQAEEAHRFRNIPVQAGDRLYWDVLRLWNDVRTGIDKAGQAESLGLDTWGVDFALLDKQGRLLSNPVHYRDARSVPMMDWVFERIPRREVYERTGIQFMSINSLYHVASLIHENSSVLEAAGTYLTISDIFNYWLSGSRTCEYTQASTSQMLNARARDWDYEMLGQLGLPTEILPPLVYAGTEIGTYQGIRVIAPACHDTGSAVAAVPATDAHYAYLSSGTWSLIGLEMDEPVISDASYEANLTNEGGAYGTYRLLKNIMGLWLVQQCRQTWINEGTEYSYEQLVSMAESAEPFYAVVNPDDVRFLPPGDMPGRVRDFCRETGQAVPETVGQVVRVVYESLALKYRHALDLLLRTSGRQVDRLHIIGGGSRNALLNQMTANAINRQVIAGPVEATAIGNVLIQLIAMGELSSLADGRAMLAATMDTEGYSPVETDAWEAHYQASKHLLDDRS